jgi:hypothetical protein
MDAARAEKLLEALGEILESQDDGPYDIVVCGGMALIMQGIVERRTTDIDALGVVTVEGGLLSVGRPVSTTDFDTAVARVAGIYGEQVDWFNFAATNQLEMTMPAGLVDRAIPKSYGVKLTVRLCSRYDMVHLKMMASLDRGEEQTTDLSRMQPTEEEAKAAAAWCLAQGCSSYRLKALLEELGHGAIADSL